jgi:hypothetical protein
MATWLRHNPKNYYYYYYYKDSMQASSMCKIGYVCSRIILWKQVISTMMDCYVLGIVMINDTINDGLYVCVV